METTKIMTEPMAHAVSSSLRAALPSLRDRFVADLGTGVSNAALWVDATTSTITTPIFADGVGTSVTWRPPV